MQEKKISLSGGELCYRESGNEKDPVILFIHGNLASSLWYKDVMDIPGFRCIAVDLPNCGSSFHTNNFSMEFYAASVEEFLKALRIENCSIVGHSLGGVVAMELASRDRTSISRMVLVSPGPVEGLQVPKEHYPIIEQYKTNRELLKQALHGVMPGLKNMDTLERLTDTAGKMNPKAYTCHADEIGKTDYTKRLGRLPFPSLLIRGDADILITDQMARNNADFLGAQYMELAGSGHSPMVENPKEFLKIIKDFMEK